MSEIIWILIAVAALAAGYAVAMAISKNMVKSRANSIIDDARREAEVIKEKKILEAKEQEMQLLNEAEKVSNQKMQKLQTTEARLKQRELQLNQQQSDLAKRKNELDTLKTNIDNQTQELEKKNVEVDKMHKEAQETLEHISGLSAEEAKEKLIDKAIESVNQPQLLKNLSKNIAELAFKDSANVIAKEVIKLAEKYQEEHGC